MTLCIIGQEKSESNLKLLAEAKKRFGSVFFVPIDGIGIGLSDRFSIHYRATDILRFKAVLPRMSRNYSSYAYQLLSLFPGDAYMAIRPISYLLASERFFLLTVLRKRGTPTTNLNLARSTRAAIRIVESGEYPLVIRTPEKRTGVVVKNRMEAKSIIDALAHLNKPILIEDVSRDIISAYVAEPEVLAAVKKRSRSSDVLFAPGELKGHKLTLEQEQLALETARSMEAHVARIDMTQERDPRVANVELRPALIQPSKASGTNIPARMVESIKENYGRHREKPVLVKFFEDARSVMKDVLRSRQLI